MYKYVECVLRILSPRLAFKCNLLVRESYRLMLLLINTMGKTSMCLRLNIRLLVATITVLTTD